ncbi:MAG: response regulator [Anaerolineae bacterium]|nr:response regulator [Anaerolineae bacterium]
MSDFSILIVDDEILIRRALSDYLQECGYATTTAADGEDGITKARAKRFDAVLVDLRMPRVDGLEVIATLKTEQPTLPVVVVSGTGVLQDVIAAMRLGAWDYITKPIHDMDEIAVVVERVLDKARLIAERDRYEYELEALNRSLEAEVARRTRDLIARNRDLTVLNHVISAATASLDSVRVLQVLCDELAAAFHLPQVTAMLIQAEVNQATVMAEHCEPDRPHTLGSLLSIKPDFIARVLEDPQPLLLVKTQRAAHLREFFALVSHHPDDSVLVVPLVVRGQVISILSLDAAGDFQYSQDDLGLIQHAAAATAQSLETVNLHQELRQHAEALEAIVAQRTLELRAALEQAQAADKAKSQFLSSVSHELRTPLTSLRLYLGLLRRGPGTKQDEYLESLTRETDRLQTLIESLLDISRLDLGKTHAHLQPTDLNNLLQILAKDRGKLFAERGLKLTVSVASDLPITAADPKLIEQVATNLLTNAMNYTPSGGEVGMGTALSSTDTATWVTFYVQDNGPGIAEDEQKRLFERFFRGAAGLNSSAAGTGLGLAICKEIMELHHGHITLDSVENQGCTFKVWLPLVDVNNQEEVQSANA